MNEDSRESVRSLEDKDVKETGPSLEKNEGSTKVRQVGVRGVRLLVKVVVTGGLLYLIYNSAIFIAAYLSAPRLDMTMSPLTGATAVTIVLAKKGKISSTVTYTGTVIPKSVVKVFSRIEGWIDGIYVDVGDVVRKGQLLVRLDEQELLTTLAERKAHMTFTELEYQRDSRLVMEGAISQSEADRSQMMFRSAKAKVEKIKTKISYTKVTSPINGIIINRVKLINPGELVHSATHLFDMADTRQMRVQVKVAEKDSHYVRVGTRATIRFPSLPKSYNKINARVSTVFPKLNLRTRTSTVELLIDNPKGNIRVDMYAVVDFVLRRKSNAVIIPRQAVLQVEGETVVFITDTVVAEKMPVVLGISSKDMVEVVKGIKAGDRVITKGARGLTDFQEVTVVSGF